MPAWEPFFLTGTWTPPAPVPVITDPANIVATARDFGRVQVFASDARSQIRIVVALDAKVQTTASDVQKVTLTVGESAP